VSAPGKTNLFVEAGPVGGGGGNRRKVGVRQKNLPDGTLRSWIKPLLDFKFK